MLSECNSTTDTDCDNICGNSMRRHAAITCQPGMQKKLSLLAGHYNKLTIATRLYISQSSNQYNSAGIGVLNDLKTKSIQSMFGQVQ